MLNFNHFITSYRKDKKRIISFIFVVVFITILSSRLLSDPDLGFHLNSGKYIIENFSFPDKDTFTYTSTHNDYVDLQWFFQVIIFILYNITGYVGLSVFVAFLSLLLLYLLIKRLFYLKIPLPISCILILAGYLIIESRIVLRPEVFTFIFITLLLFLLDRYYYTPKKNLYWLPVILLLWCNMHSLFILGFFIIGSYFVSIFIRDKKIDKHFLLWFTLSILICFINPYFTKSFTFPLELFTRLDSNNIFNQYIKEFQSIFEIDIIVLKYFLFIVFISITYFLFLFTIRNRKFHEFLLLVTFTYLALTSIRNIPLFVIIAIPIAGSSLASIINSINTSTFLNKFQSFFYYGIIILSIGLILRAFTNSLYYSNNSPYKFGFGIDKQQQPVFAADFINKNHLNGKILNSLGVGAWLSWSTTQPVFIDARLEVIKEAIYEEVVESWKENGLSKLVFKYKPNLIIYNYPKYYSWTKQLNIIQNWRLLYIDGQVAVFAQKEYAPQLPVVNYNELFTRFHVPSEISESEKAEIINLIPDGKFMQWLNGFYSKTDYTEISLLNIASFCMQNKQYNIAESFFLENYKRTRGKNNFILYALADIYKITGNKHLSDICYKNILKFDPENKTVLSLLEKTENHTISLPDTSSLKNTEDEAVLYFNSGNSKYKNKDIDGALKDYDKAISIKPDYFKAYNNRGIIYASELGLNNEALKDFDKAIEIKPDYSDAYLGRGSVKFSLKNNSGACKDWEMALKLGNVQAKVMIEKYCKQ